MTIKEVYEKYKEYDTLLSDMGGVSEDMWQAIKEEVEKQKSSSSAICPMDNTIQDVTMPEKLCETGRWIQSGHDMVWQCGGHIL